MAGFATAIAHRGCRHVRLPSTTLAQADSGVGVKNGLNLFGKKNFAGTFAPPWAVINDFAFLQSLDPRDRRGGLAEAVKVSLIRDAEFFQWLEQHAADLVAPDTHTLETAIQRSASLHARHIATCGDPFELGSARPLDFGHWSAHKLEQLSGFTLRHGDAVAIGIALDTLYSVQQGWLDHVSGQRVLNLLRALGFELSTPELQHPDLLTGIEEFREHLGGQLTLTFLRGIGLGFETHHYDPDPLSHCLSALGSHPIT
jgi:3-dehydroquinate synthase